jgi:hypothetical protein
MAWLSSCTTERNFSSLAASSALPMCACSQVHFRRGDEAAEFVVQFLGELRALGLHHA